MSDSGMIKPKCKLTGKDGNVFNLIGLARKVLVKAGKEQQSAEMTARCFKAHAYDEVLCILAEYVDIW